MAPYFTFVMSRFDKKQVDPLGRKALRMMPWGWFQVNRYSDPLLSTVGPTPLHGPFYGHLFQANPTNQGMKTFADYEQIYLDYDDRLEFRDQDGILIHKFGYW